MKKFIEQEPEGFEDFWLFWRKTARHTDGRGKCRREYIRQLLNGAMPEDILLAAQYHVRNTKDLAFIPLAATWLNAEKWVDEAPREREFVAMQQHLASQAQNVIPIKTAKPLLPANHFSRQWAKKKEQAW